jgi:glycosyltransferase involved in cell wall biosynthesis
VTPVLSVLLSVRNGEATLPAAVASILEQSFRDFELLVVDDGSEDGSAEYVASLSDPRVRLLREPPRGLGGALNRGLEEVRTPLVARMDADDVALPERLARQVAFLDAHPEVGLLGAGFAFTLDGVARGPAPPMPRTHAQIVGVLERGGHALCHPTIVVRTEAMRAVGGYRVHGVGQDWDLMLRLTERTRAANLPEVLLLYRLSRQSSAWSKAGQTVLGKKYALAMRRARREGRPELSPEAFLEDWNASPSRRLGTRVEALSEMFYREGLLQRLHGRPLAGLALTGAAAAANPRKVALRLWRASMGG